MPTNFSIFDSTKEWALSRHVESRADLETGSTNDNAKANALNETADLVLYLAGHQTHGRGRAHNQWLDTGSGDSLLSTWSFHLEKSPQSITGPRVGLALFRAVKHAWPALKWSLKAPNDLFLDGKKVAGLLVESVSDSRHFRLMIGLGMNVFNFPRSFQTATDLSSSLKTPVEQDAWYRFLDELKNQLQFAAYDSTDHELGEENRDELMHAINANPAKVFTVTSISPHGDLHHAGGIFKWTEL